MPTANQSRYDFRLEPREIDRAAERISGILSDFDVEGKTILRARLLIAVILTALLTYACPPIPGSFLVIFGVIARQFGFPDECLVLLATADILLDSLSSALCCLLRNAALIFEADDYHELNREALRQLQ